MKLKDLLSKITDTNYHIYYKGQWINEFIGTGKVYEELDYLQDEEVLQISSEESAYDSYEVISIYLGRTK